MYMEVIHRDAAAGCPAILTAENSRGEGSRVIGNITNASPRKRTETTEDDETGDTKRNKGAER